MQSFDDELYDLFVNEGHEHLEVLQTSLLNLERSAGDRDAVRDAFRASHSMKGMAATMGLVELTDLMHILEDVLGDIRDGVRTATPDVVSAMLQGVDCSMQLLDAFTGDETAGSADVDVAPVLNLLRELADLGSVEAEEAATANASRAAMASAHDVSGPDTDTTGAAREAGFEVLRLEIRPDEASLMPAARAYAAVLQAQDHGELIAISPAMSELEAGELVDGSVCLWMATTETEEGIAEALATCSEITSITVAPWHPTTSASDQDDATPAGASALGEQRVAERRSEDASLAARSRTVRVDSDRLDSLMHSVGELLVRRARVENIARRLYDAELLEAIDEMSHAAREMQTQVMDVRMVSIDLVLRRLPRLVRDLEHALGKQVDLQISGGSTELDRTVIDLLGDPLVHLVRNAMDHGIETPAERAAAGKPERGTLSISASAADGIVLLRVRDDGSGMDPERIRRTAVERGLVREADVRAMPDDQVLQLCFMPGFSTREAVSDVSGRGVGLDVVRASVRSLGGDVLVDSSDAGTQMTIKLPLTLAIVPVLLVRCAGHSYALPVTRVNTIVEESAPNVTVVAGRPSIDLGDSVLRIADLGELLEEPSIPTGEGSIVLVEGGDSTIALRVDSVVSQAEVVTRPIPTVLRSSPYLSASATLGDGDIAFLLDTEAIASSVNGRARHVSAA